MVTDAPSEKTTTTKGKFLVNERKLLEDKLLKYGLNKVAIFHPNKLTHAFGS